MAIDRFHFSPEIVSAAARRWEETRAGREKAARAEARHQYDKVDSAERIAKHANRLRGQVLREVRHMGPEEMLALPDGVRELVERDEPVRAEEIEPQFVERVLGPTRDFLSVEFFDLAALAIRSVARIVTRFDGQLAYGTGFMVSEDLLITNHHVLETAQWAAASVAEFDYQRDHSGGHKRVQRFRLDPVRFFLSDRALDYALVAVAAEPDVGGGRLASYGFCPLVGLEGKILVTHPVNIVQHPQGRLKEVVIRENQLTGLPEAPHDSFAHYVADTEPGSSGSPVFNDRWEVIALHHSAVPDRDAQGRILTLDGRVWNNSIPPTEIRWIGNEGIRISRIIHNLRQKLEGLADAKRDLLTALLNRAETDRPGPVRTGESEALPGAAQAAFLPVGTSTVTVPLTITVAVGADARHAGLLAAEAADSVRPDSDYASRKGFDRGFLGAEVAMPRLVDDRHGALAELEDGAGELRYHHFSVLMNADRRLAYVSAVNYDAAAPFVHERGRDSWFLDPRLAAERQADNRFYKNNPLDRGHLTRRLDAGWGATPEEAKLANDDTFHWTNCSPQHEVFNQSSKSQPKDLRLWGELENHVTAQAQNGLKRLSIFNGPVFEEEDRQHRGLFIPSAFWKVVAYRSRSGDLRALGFILHQADLISNLAVERFDVGKFDLRQVRISRIEELTGLDFAGLRNCDPMALAGVRELFEGAAPGERQLHDAKDIMF